MPKRQQWSSEQDNLLSSVVSSFKGEHKKFKWPQITCILRDQNPKWNRDNKQCRERWFYHLRPNLEKTEQLNEADLQKLLQLVRVHGKRWSLIGKEMSGRTDSCIKNFFYAALRRGLRNLNFYNTQLRSPKRYKVYQNAFLNKILSVHDQKKRNELFILDESVYQLAQKIRQGFTMCSRKQIKCYGSLPPALQNFYEILNSHVEQICRLCKFKKSRNKKTNHIGGQNFSLAQRYIQNDIKIKKSELNSQEKGETIEQKQLNMEEMGLQYISLIKLAEVKLEPIKQNDYGKFCKIEEDWQQRRIKIQNQSIFQNQKEKMMNEIYDLFIPFMNKLVGKYGLSHTKEYDYQS